MQNSCDLPVVLTGGGRSPAMPRRPGEPIICAAGRSRSPSRSRRGERYDGVLDGFPDGVEPAYQASRRHHRPAVADLPATVEAEPAQRGSQTTEYALLLIVAATITMLALTWAKQGAIKTVLDGVIGQVLALFGIGAG